jgi:hypothetical protein
MPQNIMAATSALPSVLVAQHLTTTAETTVYTGPAGSAVKIAAAAVSNTGSVPVTVAVSIVKTGGAAGVTNRVAGFVLPAGESSTLAEIVGHFLGPGDFVSAKASVASVLSVVFSGVVFS